MDTLISYLRTNPLPCVARSNVSDCPVPSVTLGMVKCRQQVTCQISEATSNDKLRLLQLILALFSDQQIEGEPPSRFTSICINVDFACSLHTDKYNEGTSVIVGCGDYVGGTIFLEDGEGEHEVEHAGQKMRGKQLDVRHRWCMFDAHQRHMVLPYEGYRVTVVFFSVPASKCDPQNMAVLQSLGFRVPPPTCGVSWPWPYKVFVCSSGRSGTIAYKTLTTLLGDKSIAPAAVTICTKDSEVQDYSKLGLNLLAISNGGLPEQRALCCSGLPADTCALFADDDVTRLLKPEHLSVHELVILGFLATRARRALLWGLNTSQNEMHLRENVSSQVGLVNGYFFGVITCEGVDFRSMTKISNGAGGAAEDIERSLRYFQHSGICRLNFAAAVASTKTNPGGLQEEFGSKAARQVAHDYVVRRLEQEFPTLLRYAEDSPNRCAFVRPREPCEAKLANICAECCREYARKADLVHHNQCVHGNGPTENFECSTCHKRFLTKRSLQVHIKNGRCYRGKGRPPTAREPSDR